MTAAAELEQLLDVSLDDPGLLERALTHRSYAFEEGLAATNERLEFLGDAVLALVVTDLIYHEMPAAEEGTLAKLRSAAVKTSALAGVARELELGVFVQLGKGETASGGADKDSILADTFEAVLGAVYLDRGYAVAAELVERLFADRLRKLATRGAALDYKTSLQELTAARFDSLPAYQLQEEGPDHRKRFTAAVTVDGQTLGVGRGGSKKKAEQAAARIAYLRLTGAGDGGRRYTETGDAPGRPTTDTREEDEGARTP